MTSIPNDQDTPTVAIQSISTAFGAVDEVKYFVLSLLEGKNQFSRRSITCNIVLDEAYIRPITAVAYSYRPAMISCGSLMKSFAGFRQLATVR